MISVVRRRTLSNNSNIDFEKLNEVVLDEMKGDYPKVVVTPPPKERFIERIPARYVLTFLTFLGLGIQYTQRVNLNVTMVAMVNSSFIEGKENDTTMDECSNIFAHTELNVTSPIPTYKQGDVIGIEQHYDIIFFNGDRSSRYYARRSE